MKTTGFLVFVVFLTGATAKHPLDCTFEAYKVSLNSWTPEGVAGLQWTILSKITLKGKDGPEKDNTFKNGAGKFGLINPGGAASGATAALISDEAAPTTSTGNCLRFYYNSDLNGVTLSLGLRPKGGTYFPLWSMTFSVNAGSPTGWTQAQLPFWSRDRFRLVAMATLGDAKSGFLAVDDMEVKAGLCNTIPDDAVASTLPTFSTPNLSTSPRPSLSPPGSHDCDFETPCDSWTQEPGAAMKFQRRQGAKPGQTPELDHTTGSAKGWFLHLDAGSGNVPNDVAELKSKYKYPASYFVCVQFWFFMNGPSLSELQLRSKDLAGDVLMWSRNGTQGDGWQKGKAFVSFRPADFNLVFRYTGGGQGDVALDDISVHPTACPNSHVCDFDVKGQICGYQLELKGDGNFQSKFNWKQTLGKSGDIVNDHTSGSVLGGYLFMSDSNCVNANDAGAFATYLMKPTQGACLVFYYHTKGNSYGTLSVSTYSLPGGMVSQLWQKSASWLAKKWEKAEVTIPAQNKEFRVVFKGTCGNAGWLSNWSEFGIDDVELTTGACGEAPGECDFEEKNLCDWSNDRDGDDFDWIVGRGTNGGDFTGPDKDHTKESKYGYYAYVKGKDQNVGDKAFLMSEVLMKSEEPSCFEFYYYMNGMDIGSLYLYLVANPDGPSSSPPTPKLLWWLNGEQKKDWLNGRVTIQKQNQPYRLRFVAIRGVGDRGAIAIDDLSILSSSCALTPSTADPAHFTTPAPTTTVATTTPFVPSSLGCDFDRDICGWKKESNTSPTYLWSLGTSPSGPKRDHTSGSGFYVFVDASHGVDGDRATLVSPQLTIKPVLGSSYCFSFWYHMYGQNVGGLNVKTRNSGNEKTIWTRKHQQGNAWQRARLTIDEPFDAKDPIVHVALEATRGDGSMGDVAVDDVDLHTGICANAIPTLACDFETNLCGWSPTDSDVKFKWERTSGPTKTGGTGPSVDHTTGTDRGHYVAIDASRSTTKGKQASLISIDHRTNGKECLRFYYHMYGPHIGTLAIYWALPGTYSNIGAEWARNSDQGDAWRLGMVTLDSGKLKSKLEFVATSAGPGNNGGQGDIALDDLTIVAGACPPEGDCDFEMEFCLWTNEDQKSDEIDWLIGSGDSDSGLKGPSNDHTTSSSSGSYAFVESLGKPDIGKRARMRSEKREKTESGGQCLTFWFAMSDASHGTLTVSVIELTSGVETPLWSLTGASSPGTWTFAQIAFVLSGEYVVVLETSSMANKYSYVAVDDIVFKEGHCATTPSIAGVSTPQPPTTMPTTTMSTTTISTGRPNFFDCDFESGFCSWRHNLAVAFQWSRGSGKTAPQGPKEDHTKGDESGQFVYIHPRVATGDTLDVARLASPLLSPTMGRCLSFWYFMHGPHVNSLRVYATLTNPPSHVVWQRRGTDLMAWRQAHVDLVMSSTFMVIFEGKRGTSFDGIQALDDIKLSDSPCPGAPSTDCDFENPSICGFVNSTSGDFQWRRHKGKTKTHGTGPMVDHTKGTEEGYYVYIETNSPLKYGDVAHLLTPVYSGTENHCFSFWHHMRGKYIERLNVFLVDETTKTNTTIVSLVGDRGDRWQLYQTPLHSKGAFRILFEGVRGQQSYGDIALDDIKIAESGCNAIGTCDFETGMCGWSQTFDDDFDWMLGRGATADSFTGPPSDHTIQSDKGFYLFVDASPPRKMGDEAVVVSEMMRPATKCLEFWYHMWGQGTGTLRIELRVNATTPLSVWELSGQQEDEWNFGSVGVAGTGGPFQIAIVAVRGSNHLGDIAVDDLEILDKDCPTVPKKAKPVATTQPPPTTSLPTRPPLGPNDCDFESDFCSWQHDVAADFKWVRAQGPTESEHTGPTIDHTTGSMNGYYAYIETSSPRKFNESASLLSPHLSSSSCFSFFYHAFGFDVNKIQVGLRGGGGGETVVWQHEGSKDDKWYYSRVNVRWKLKEKFRLALTAFVGRSYESDIAVDDLKIVDGECPTSTTDPFVIADFEESSLSGYTSTVTSGSVDPWKVVDGGSSVGGESKPVVDHSTGTAVGKYMTSTATKKKSTRSNSLGTTTLSSPKYGASSQKSCLQFHYLMDAGKFNVYVVYDGVSTLPNEPAFSRTGDEGPRWLGGQVSILPSRSFQFVFEAAWKSSPNPSDVGGSVSLDDILVSAGSCRAAGFCDFEDDVCDWTNVAKTNNETTSHDWLRGSGATGGPANGPPVDKTTGTAEGHYLFLDLSAPHSAKDVAIVASSTFSVSFNARICVSFYWRVEGDAGDGNASPGALEATAAFGTTLRALKWRAEGDAGQTWNFGQFSIVHYGRLQVMFRAVLGDAVKGHIALDDITIKFLDHECELSPSYANPTMDAPLKGSCSFDFANSCFYTQDTNDDTDWVIQDTPTTSLDTGPRTDHSGAGYYAYLETSSKKEGQKARLVSPILPPSAPKGNCLSFYYHMFGATMGNLTVYTELKGTTFKSRWFHRVGNQGNRWIHAQFNLGFYLDHVIIFEATVGRGYRGDIAIDDLELTTQPCGHKKQCDFEDKSLCDWTIMNGDLKWALKNLTSARNSGPTIDHTLRTARGHVLLLDASATHPIDSRAILKSGKIRESVEKAYLTFWYHMWGRQQGKMQVFIVPFDAATPTSSATPVWEKRGDQRDIWRIGVVEIPPHKDAAVRVYIIATPGAHPSATIALDDLELSPFTSFDGRNCDFEVSACGWENSAADDFDWTESIGHTSSAGTGPSQDHTTGKRNGGMIYIETSNPVKRKDKALFHSPSFQPISEACFTFWYHMYGDGNGTLNILQRELGNGASDETKTLFHKTGNFGDIWIKAQLPISSPSSSFELILEGIKGDNFRSDVAVDDVSLKDGACVNATVAPPTAPPFVPRLVEGTRCDFENSTFCGYTSTPDKGKIWEIGTGHFKDTTVGPKADHTLGTLDGHYIHVTSAGYGKNYDCVLASPVFILEQTSTPAPISPRPTNPVMEPFCVEFFLRRQGWSAPSFDIFLKFSGSKTNVFSVVGEDDDVWRHYTLPLEAPSGVDVQIDFRVKNLYTYSWDIAMDDLAIYRGDCPPKRTCDFETDLSCGFTQSSWDDFDWIRVKGSKTQSVAAPSIDHSTNTGSGHFFLADANQTAPNYAPSYRGHRAILHSGTHVEAPHGACLTFWYYANGDNFVKLEASTVNHVGSYDTLWSVTSNLGTKWHVTQATVPPTSSSFQIAFDAFLKIRSQAKGVVGIDDVDLDMRGPCLPPGGCNFEEGFCLWQQSQDDDVDWTRHRGATHTVGTGPTRDHTTNSEFGYYLYLESNGNSQLINKTATLISQTFTEVGDTGRYCFTFWYNMYGNHVKSLRVSARHISSSTPISEWETSGNQGKEWQRGGLTISAFESFNIFISAQMGDGNGDIAIDDLKLTPGVACIDPGDRDEFDCKDGTKIDAKKKCDWIENDCKNGLDEANCGKCSFELGVCGFDVRSDGSYKWRRGRNGTVTANTGPTVDHTTNGVTGYYMVVEANTGSSYDMAELLSPLLQPTAMGCQLEFYYHMYGYGIGNLRVDLRPADGISEDTMLFQSSGNKGDKWQKGLINLGHIRFPFEIVFKAERSWSILGDIAIDDVNFINCEYPPILPSCGPDQFRCARKSCVSTSALCDFNDDCGDESDETDVACADDRFQGCDFETSATCDWKQDDQEDDFDWDWFSGATSSYNTGPSRDHTRGTAYGSYLLLEASGIDSGSIVRLLSPVFAATGSPAPSGFGAKGKREEKSNDGSIERKDLEGFAFVSKCSIRLFFHMYGVDVATLRVLTRTSTGGGPTFETERWRHDGEVGDYWERTIVDLEGIDEPFQVIIEGIRGKSFTSDIGIDDVSFTDKCLRHDGPLPTVLPPTPTTPPLCAGDEFACYDGKSDGITSTLAPPVCLPKEKVCDFIPNCNDGRDEGECGQADFETSSGGWEDVSTSKYMWTKESGKSGAKWGPDSDHTFQNSSGHYMMVEGGKGVSFGYAVLASPILGRTSSICQLTFWLHKTGKDAGTIIVSIESPDNSFSEIYRRSGNQGSDWVEIKADVGQLEAGHWLKIEVQPASGFFWGVLKGTDIAVDDISLENCAFDAEFNKTIECDFEKDFCGLYQTHGRGDDFDWIRATSSIDSSMIGDHTSGSGYFVYFDAGLHFHDIGLLHTGPLEATDGSCFSFFYHIDSGVREQELNVIQSIDGGDWQTIWTTDFPTGAAWREGVVFVTSPSTFELAFEGFANNCWGKCVVALDDVRYSPKECPQLSRRSCNFESGFCKFNNDPSMNFEWIRHQGSTKTGGTGPDHDHTTHTDKGTYVYLETSDQSKDDVAQLVGPAWTPRPEGECLRFWYSAYGKGVGQLNVYTKVQGHMGSPLWTLPGAASDSEWRLGQVSLLPDKKYQLVFEGIVGFKGFGDYALDDIEVLNGVCPPKGHCDFEGPTDMTTTCGWRNVHDKKWDNFDWVFGAAKEMAVGPGKDHTTRTPNGNVLYNNQVANIGNGEKAILISEDFRDPKVCLRFYFVQSGSSAPQIRVYLIVGSIRDSIIAEFNGDRGNYWNLFNATVVGRTDVVWQMGIQVEKVSDGQATVALDDIQVFSGTCEDYTTVAPPTTTPGPTTTPMAESQDCDFEKEKKRFCQWTQDTDDDFDWDLGKGSTFSFATGPSSDHTTRTAEGYYIYIEASYTQEGERAAISTPVSLDDEEDAGICLQFWFHMYGMDIGALEVAVKDADNSSNSITVWRRSGTHGDDWKHAQVHLDSGAIPTGAKRTRVAFVGVAGVWWQGDIAIDDVKATKGACPVARECGFEDPSLCGYTNSDWSDFDWQWTVAKANDDHEGHDHISGKRGPTTDHTTQTGDGHFLSADSNDTSLRPRDRARLISPTHEATPKTAGKCLRFFYHVTGDDVGSLRVKRLQSNSVKETLWELSGPVFPFWNGAGVTVHSHVPFQIEFEAEIGLGPRGYIGLDDVFIAEGECPPSGYCNFEDEYCLWHNIQDLDDFDWTVHFGETPSGATGPSVDHTIGTAEGHYLYIEASGKQPGGVAWFASTVYTPMKIGCLQFAYHMNGQSIGSLKAFLWTGDEDPLLLFHQNKSMGTEWKEAAVEFHSTKNFVIQIIGEVGTDFASDIAIDDLLLSPTACPSTGGGGGIDCGDQTIDASKVCDFEVDCINGTDERFCGTCDFEDAGSGMCGWKDTSKGPFKWSTQVGPTTTNFTGPDSDHTLGKIGDSSGTYLATHGNLGHADDVAVLESPLFQHAGAGCMMDFWFSNYGFHIGYFKIYMNISGHDSVLLFQEFDGWRDKTWESGRIYIGRVEKPFRIQVKAQKLYGARADFGLDDFSFFDCALPPVRKKCNPWEKTCTRGSCVAVDRLCDYTDDCGDYWDELPKQCIHFPLRDNFEFGLGGWTQDDADDLDWTWHQGPTSSFDTGPHRDHTTGLKTGHYVYLETSYPARTGDVARLLSPVWKATNKKDAAECYMVFHYHMNGDHIEDLQIFQRTTSDGAGNLIWHKWGHKGMVWNRAKVTLTSDKPFQIIISASVYAYRGDVAVDDILFGPGCNLAKGTTLPPQPPTPPPTLPPCDADLLDCGDGVCLNKTKMCDFRKDCVDGRDEKDCGSGDFQNGMMGWTDQSYGDYSFVRAKGYQNKESPVVDHTMSNSSGYYVYLENGGNSFLSNSYLEGPIYHSRVSSVCEMRFWYFAYGYIFDEIRLWIWHTDQYYGYLAWSGKVDRNMYRWREATVYLGRDFADYMKGRWHLEFDVAPARTTTPAPSTASVVAFDDILLTNCNPLDEPPDISCDFEFSSCDWTQSPNANLKWTRASGETLSVGTGPIYDHTKGANGKGYYMYIETSGTVTGQKANLLSPRLEATKPNQHCFELWYHMYGYDVEKLNVYVDYLFGNGTSKKVLLWTRRGSHGNQWKRMRETIYSDFDYQISVEAAAGYGFQGDIAVDDFRSFVGACPTGGVADFEHHNASDWGGWVNRGGDNLDWDRTSGKTGSIGTGPHFDHTTGAENGHYVYLETSGSSKKGDVAILWSPLQKANEVQGPQCLSFFYHMFGPDVASLSVYQKTTDILFPGLPIWRRDGDHGNVWRRARIDLPRRPKDYEVMFSGEVGRSWLGDIALDDLTISAGVCPSTSNCDFETDDCGWENLLLKDKSNWLRNHGPTSSGFTGPTVDHTTGTSLGFYVYIEASLMNDGDDAVLVSEFYEPTKLGCLRFWYHMYGADVGVLSVWLREGPPSMKPKMLMEIKGDQGDVWTEAAVEVRDISKLFVFEINATRGFSWLGDIAIDDLGYVDGVSCVVPTTTPTSPPSTVAPPLDVKDCDFLLDFCQWTHDSSTDFRWRRVTGTTSNGPDAGHTTGTKTDGYIVIDTGYQNNKKVARIASTPFGVNKKTACFSFWYYMYGRTVASLEVKLADLGSDEEIVVWRHSGDKGPVWKFAQIHLQIIGNYKLVMEATGGSGYDSVIAVDDLFFSPGECDVARECDFENGLCGYTQDKNDDFDWILGNGSLPRTDHTYGTGEGHYMFVETSTHKPGQSTKLVSPTYKPTRGSCLRFWYHSNGAFLGFLTVKLNQYGVDTPLWSTGGAQGDEWHVGEVEINSALSHSIVFEGSQGKTFADGYSRGSDDLYYKFHSEDASWFEARDACVHEGAWLAMDKTLVTRNYLKSAFGSKGEMWVGVTDAGTEGVFRFVDGTNVTSPHWGRGEPNDAHGDEDCVETNWGTPGNWNDRRCTTRKPFLCQSEARGDVALDDISLSDGDCLPLGACDFESGDLCTWKQLSGDGVDELDWSLNKGGTTSVATGPAVDHTKGDALGKYIYLESSHPARTGDRAKLGSPTYQDVGASGRCIEFYYHMKGDHMGHLNLYVEPFSLKNESNPEKPQVVWTHGVAMGDNWNYAQKQVHWTEGPYRFVFEAEVGDGFLSDIAIDDISVSVGACPPPPINSTGCAVKCGDPQGTCVDLTRVCDFTCDCADNCLDEKNCGFNCDFENGTCGWTDYWNTTFKWEVGQGSTADDNTGPDNDHTIGDDTGHYMYVDASNGPVYDYADLLAPQLKQTSASCEMTFWYHMYGDHIGELYLVHQQGNVETDLFERRYDQGKQWHQARVFLGRHKKPSKLYFNAFKSHDVRGE